MNIVMYELFATLSHKRALDGQSYQLGALLKLNPLCYGQKKVSALSRNCTQKLMEQYIGMFGQMIFMNMLTKY